MLIFSITVESLVQDFLALDCVVGCQVGAVVVLFGAGEALS